MYRFLYRPRWILLHLLVAALVVAMLYLMSWQIRRLHDKQAVNAQVEQGSRRPAVSVREIVGEVRGRGADAVRFRAVKATGTFDASAEVTIANRTFDGAPGKWVATPFTPTDGGPTVLVVRGWIPLSVDEGVRPIEAVAPPDGPVSIVGYLEPAQRRGSFGPTDPATGTLTELSRVDVARFARQYDGVAPRFFLQLVEQDPPTAADALQPVPRPEPDEGPHRGYAWQWAIFSIIAVVGYPLAVRRRAHSVDGQEDAGTPELGADATVTASDASGRVMRRGS